MHRREAGSGHPADKVWAAVGTRGACMASCVSWERTVSQSMIGHEMHRVESCVACAHRRGNMRGPHTAFACINMRAQGTHLLCT